MIIHLAQGEPGYLPDGILLPLRDEAHGDLAPLLYRFEGQALGWEAAVLLAEYRDWCPLETLAAALSVPSTVLITGLWPLIENNILQERFFAFGPGYRLYADHRLRRLVQLLATDIGRGPHDRTCSVLPVSGAFIHGCT